MPCKDPIKGPGISGNRVNVPSLTFGVKPAQGFICNGRTWGRAHDSLKFLHLTPTPSPRGLWSGGGSFHHPADPGYLCEEFGGEGGGLWAGTKPKSGSLQDQLLPILEGSRKEGGI